MGALLYERFRRPLGIIKVAFNGAALAISPGADWNPASRNEIYDLLISEINAAVEALPIGRTGHVEAVVWIQGESDAQSKARNSQVAEQPRMAASYERNLLELIASLRRDIGQERLAFVLAEVSAPLKDTNGREYAYTGRVAAAQQRIAAADDLVHLVSTSDLNRNEDSLHYSVGGQVELGRRIADMLGTLLGNASD